MSVLFYALMRFAPKGLLHGQHVGKCLNGGACLAKVAHLLVHAQLHMRNTGGIQSLLQVGILHFLGVAEGLHEQHQTLTKAVLARDTARASELMRQHLLTPIPIIQQAMAGN